MSKTSSPLISSKTFLYSPSNLFPSLSYIGSSFGLSPKTFLYFPSNFFLFLSNKSINGDLELVFFMSSSIFFPPLSKRVGFPIFLEKPLFLVFPPLSKGPNLFFNFPGVNLLPNLYPVLSFPSNGPFNFPGIITFFSGLSFP